MAAPPHHKTTTGNPPQQNPPTGAYPGGGAGAAYPFAVPPPPSSYSSFYQEQRPTTDFYQPPLLVRYPFLCRLLGAIVAVFTLFMLIVLIAWLILKPRLPEFRVDSASVTSLNTTGPDLTAQWDITLVVTNPNHKLSVSYDTVSASVWYGEDQVLASTRLPPLFQQTRSESRVRVQFAVVDEFVDNGVAKDIAANRAHGSVQFGVTLSAWVRFRSGIVRWRDLLLKVDCDPLRFGFSPNNGTGALMGDLICE